MNCSPSDIALDNMFDSHDGAASLLEEEVSGDRESGGRFAEMNTADMAAQCRMQARDNLDPEYSQFMTAVADRLSGFAASKSDGAPSTDWQLAYAIEWANRSVESVKTRMWAYEDALRFYAKPSSWTDGDVPCHVYAIDDAGSLARETLGLPKIAKPQA